MMELIQSIPFSFAALFPVLNPFGGALIFLSLARGFTDQQMHRLAWQVSINTFILLAIVLFSGSYILGFFGISIPIVQIGGGLLLAFIGWNILNQPSSDENATAVPTKKDPNEIAFFPLTMPITAGPGCIAVTLTIGAHETTKGGSFLSDIGSLIGIFLAALSVFICYRFARSVTKFLGKSGSEVIMRLAAFINMCIGIQILWTGASTLIHSVSW